MYISIDYIQNIVPKMCTWLCEYVRYRRQDYY